MIQVTESEILTALAKRYSHHKPPFPPRYITAAHVPNFVGSNVPIGSRVADFLAQDTYLVATHDDGRPATQVRYTHDDCDHAAHVCRPVPLGGIHRRRALHGFEVKVSRSDWLRELADPTKADAWKRFCDQWWLVCPPEVARADELPSGWGWMTYSNGKLRVRRHAPVATPEPMSGPARIGFLRAVQTERQHRAAPAPKRPPARRTVPGEWRRQDVTKV